MRWPNKTWRLTIISGEAPRVLLLGPPRRPGSEAGEFASLVSEAHYYGFYETQLEANEAKSFWKLPEASPDCSMMRVDPSRSGNWRRTFKTESLQRRVAAGCAGGARRQREATRPQRCYEGRLFIKIRRVQRRRPAAKSIIKERRRSESAIQQWPSTLGNEARDARHRRIWPPLCSHGRPLGRRHVRHRRSRAKCSPRTRSKEASASS